MQPSQKTQDHVSPNLSDAYGWAEPVEIANCYLKANGISSSWSRAAMIDEALVHLETTNRSLDPRVRSIRMLACLDRGLSRNLNPPDGDDALAAGRRLLLSVDPLVRRRIENRLHPRKWDAAMTNERIALVRIPEIERRQKMERQTIRFRSMPLLSAIKQLFGRRRSVLRT